ncbi:LysE family translocator [Vogesella indigofera]|uniref:LysE family translocator n=1 Tax=Vogesella indigofera TaxID=45465 RepID=UPI003F4324A0
MNPDTWLLYCGATLGLALTPGPNSLLALTHGALYGTRHTLFTIAGGVAGFCCLIALAMFGLGVLLQSSALALPLLKWLGAAYLLWLGWQLWRAPPPRPAAAGGPPLPGRGGLFRQGWLTALSNPKVLLFYGAFLPPFVDTQRPLLPQFLLLTLTYAVIEFGVELLLARLAGRIRPWLAHSGQRFNRVCAGLFVLIAACLPLAG